MDSGHPLVTGTRAEGGCPDSSTTSGKTFLANKTLPPLDTRSSRLFPLSFFCDLPLPPCFSSADRPGPLQTPCQRSETADLALPPSLATVPATPHRGRLGCSRGCAGAGCPGQAALPSGASLDRARLRGLLATKATGAPATEGVAVVRAPGPPWRTPGGCRGRRR